MKCSRAAPSRPASAADRDSQVPAVMAREQMDRRGKDRALPGIKRLSIALSVAIYVLLGVPVWWATTLVPRPRLPHALMQRAAAQLASAGPLLLPPLTIHVYMLAPDSPVDVALAAHQVAQQIQESQPPGSAPLGHIEVVVETGSACHRAGMTPLFPSATPRLPATPAAALPCLDLEHQLLAERGGETGTEDAAEHLDALLLAALPAPAAAQPGTYVIFALPPGAASPAAAVGQHRHAWVGCGPGGSSAPTECLRQAVVPTLLDWLFPVSGSDAVEAAAKLPISASGDATLQFTLANAPDPVPSVPSAPHPMQPRHVTWDFARFDEAYLQPLVEALSPLARLKPLSQVRLHMSMHVKPRWSDAHACYALRPKHLPTFVQSDWSLDFGLDASSGAAEGAQGMGRGVSSPLASGCGPDQARQGAGTAADAGAGAGTCSWTAEAPDAAADDRHVPPYVLHFVLFVPPASCQPLRLLLPHRGPSPTNSFWVPSWGGVHVIPQVRLPTVNYSDADVTDTTGSARTSTPPDGDRDGAGHVLPAPVELGDADMHAFAESVVSQLRVLLGMAPGPALPGARRTGSQPPRVVPAAAGVAVWEVDALARARGAADVAAAAQLLGSLSRLTRALPNLAMPMLVGQLVDDALRGVQDALSATNHGQAAAAARAAHAAAESAFSHPAILAQLSFPESHKLGVYMPFFVPALVTIAAGVAREVAHFIRRRRQHAAWREEARVRQLAGATAELPHGLSVEQLDLLHLLRHPRHSLAMDTSKPDPG